ncbi:hypothetical protein D918_08034, partial [Trichuris suis]
LKNRFQVTATPCCTRWHVSQSLYEGEIPESPKEWPEERKRKGIVEICNVIASVCLHATTTSLPRVLKRRNGFLQNRICM